MTHKLTLIALVALMMFALPASAKWFGKHSKERTSIGQLTVGQEYRLVQPVFVVRWPDTKKLSLKVPGSTGGMPASIEDYLQYPHSWRSAPDYRKLFPSSPEHGPCLEILGILPTNTKIRLTSVRKKRGALGTPRIVVLGRVGDTRFVKYEIGLHGLMHNTIGYDSKPKARPDYLVPWTETSYAPEHNNPIQNKLTSNLETKETSVAPFAWQLAPSYKETAYHHGRVCGQNPPLNQ